MTLHDELEDSHIKIAHITREAEQLLKPGQVPSYDVPRARTGIPGLDPLIEGGIPRHSLVLLVGASGTGKTTFGLQFLVEGALAGEQCLYLSDGLSDGAAHLRHFWPTAPKGIRFELFGQNHQDAQDLAQLTRIDAQRVVIDSTAEKDMRAIARALAAASPARTTVTIAEEVHGGALADSIIGLAKSPQGRTLTVHKMRWTNHSLDAHTFAIQRPGGIIMPGPEMRSLRNP